MSFIFPQIFRKNHYSYEVEFQNFTLKWIVAQGELTPYKEVDKVVQQNIFPMDKISNWYLIDCGANIGLFSLFFKDCQQIIAIEPNPECCNLMDYNFKKNGVNGTIINKAVSSQIGEIKMNISSGSSVLSKVDDHGNTVVPTITIDQVINESKLPVIDLLKLDLEGHEIEALKGAVSSLQSGKIKRIYAEYNSPDFLDKLDSFLMEFNYHRTKTLDWNALYEL